MPILPYIPARDSRHRVAALALYRALVRSARAIPLPDDVVGAAPRGRQAVADLVRRRFAKHRPYTSLRLIYAAMAAGYRFLTIFAKARTPASEEHRQVVDLIRARARPASAPSPAKAPADEHDRLADVIRAQRVPATSAGSRVRAAAAPSAPTSAPSTATSAPPAPPPLPAEPLIKNVAPPGEPPRYVSSLMPRPQSSLKGPRRVPALCTTSHGQPFLRIRKPQPQALSKMVGRKEKLFKKKLYKVVEIIDEGLSDADWEDEWDRLVDDLARRELGRPSCAEEGNRPQATFRWSVLLSRLWLELKLEKTWQDWTARGTALHELVEQERALAAQESGEAPQAEAAPDRKPAPDQRPPEQQHGSRARRGHGAPPALNVAECTQPPSRLLVHALSGGKDPFIDPAWAALIEAEERRLTGRLLSRADQRRNAMSPSILYEPPGLQGRPTR